MRKKLIAGNWKMHGSGPMVSDLLAALKSACGENERADMAVFPPFPYLAQTRDLLQDSNICWGGQTLYPEEKGAFTGEVSAGMLRDLGCHYVLVGHSERRSLFGESNADVARRFQAAQAAGLEPHPRAKAFRAWINENRLRFGRVIGTDLTPEHTRVLDLSVGSLELGHYLNFSAIQRVLDDLEGTYAREVTQDVD